MAVTATLAELHNAETVIIARLQACFQGLTDLKRVYQQPPTTPPLLEELPCMCFLVGPQATPMPGQGDTQRQVTLDRTFIARVIVGEFTTVGFDEGDFGSEALTQAVPWIGLVRAFFINGHQRLQANGDDGLPNLVFGATLRDGAPKPITHASGKRYIGIDFELRLQVRLHVPTTARLS